MSKQIRIVSAMVGARFPCTCGDGKVEKNMSVGNGYYEVRCHCERRWLMSYTGAAWRIVGDDVTKLKP